MSNDLPDLPEIPDEVLISDPSQFEALTSGLRMRILKLCREPLSVREIAGRLEMPVTRLYYHVNLLEDAGFLLVVHTRKSGARLEKVYRIAGRVIQPGPDLIANVQDTASASKAMTAIVMEPARADTEDALRRQFGGDDLPMSLGRTTARLTPDQVETLKSRLLELVEEIVGGRVDPTEHDALEYSFTYSLVPADLG